MSVQPNVTHRMRLLTVLAGTLIVGTSAVLAHSAPRGYGHHEPGAMNQIRGIVGTLSLTSDQQAAVDKIFAAHHDVAIAGGNDFRTAARALADQIHAETFDEAAIRQAAATVAGFEADRAVLDASMLNDIRAQLTPEQRTRFQQALSNRDGMTEPMGPVAPRDRIR